MTVQKRILHNHRRRVLPREGFSWVERRFFRDGFADALSGAEILLYFFLCSAADQDGISFYGDRRIGRAIKLGEVALDQARRGLIRKDMIAYQAPLYQVLSLPENAECCGLQDLTATPATPTRTPTAGPDASIATIGQILKGFNLS